MKLPPHLPYTKELAKMLSTFSLVVASIFGPFISSYIDCGFHHFLTTNFNVFDSWFSTTKRFLDHMVLLQNWRTLRSHKDGVAFHKRCGLHWKKKLYTTVSFSSSSIQCNKLLFEMTLFITSAFVLVSQICILWERNPSFVVSKTTRKILHGNVWLCCK